SRDAQFGWHRQVVDAVYHRLSPGQQLYRSPGRHASAAGRLAIDLGRLERGRLSAQLLGYAHPVALVVRGQAPFTPFGPRSERPRSRREAEQRDQRAALHSITSSARASSVGGISMPSARAVGRLMTNWNLVDCTTGRSVGLAPLRMRPV